MGRGCALVLVVALAGGCAGDRSVSPAAWLQKLRSPGQSGGVAADVVRLDVYQIQFPLADSAHYAELWSFIDEGDQTVPLEKRAQLEENGLRVGKVGGNPPGELLELLTEKRTCPNPRQMQVPLGKEERLVDCGPARPAGRFQLVQGEKKTPVELEQAQFAFAVKPTLAEGGKVCLHLEPRVKHANKNFLPWRPKADRSGWTRDVAQPAEAFESLSCEVTLAPGELLVLGARADRPETFGQQSFLCGEEQVPMQRLLVIRPWYNAPRGKAEPLPFGSDKELHAAPLAIQASQASVRGARP